MKDLALDQMRLVPRGDDPEEPVRVVVVDGHAIVRDALPMLLEEAGVNVVAAVAVGSLAEEVIALYSPDVVLIGLDLPDADPFELTRSLVRGGATCPIAIYCLDEDEATLASALRAGAAGVIARARPLTQVGDALRSVADGNLFLGGRHDMATAVHHGRHASGVSLTDAEQRVLVLLAAGRTTDGIAADLHVSPHTVRSHLKSVLAKLGAQTRAHAVATAFRQGLLS